MAFTMIPREQEVTYQKGDIVAYIHDELESAYVVKEVDKNGYAILNGIRLSEYKDDIVNVQLYASINDIYLIDECKINQIGYLMKVLKERIMNGGDVFAFDI